MTFTEFFAAATNHAPYPWQGRLANGKDYKAENPATHTGTACESKLIDIPTGLGKTAGVVLAWLWNRRTVSKASPQDTNTEGSQPTQWPRRLIYCLPMRTLVEQTEREARNWVSHLAQKYPETVGNQRPRVVVLMGGESPEGRDKDWDIHPEEEAILIGTQDMLLSRALNRGYGMSRYRWPMHFALLNNDCLWVMDEVQLMGVGVESSAQMQGFREKMATNAACRTWWMSATLDDRHLETVDFRESKQNLSRLRLDEADRGQESVAQRESSRKPIRKAQSALSGTKQDDEKAYVKALAAEVLETCARVAEDALTLVIVNRVERSQKLYDEIVKCHSADDCLLIHSRFRETERAEQRERLETMENSGGIVVATQAIEAGVDLSAKLLFTEIAPWPSIVQRVGRANRKGEFDDAEIYWLDLPDDEKAAAPYSPDDFATARQLLGRLNDASPRNFSALSAEYEPALPVRPVIRRKDLLELFDTTPDLTGSDIDVSRYIRESDDTDVLVYWRDFAADATPKEIDEPPPERHEICRVPVGKFSDFGKKHAAFRWNPLDERWEKATRAVPGQTFLLAQATGGYHEAVGWTGDPKARPENTFRPRKPEPQDRYGDTDQRAREPISLDQHTQDVRRELKAVIEQLVEDKTLYAHLDRAALWHDVGKAHPEFQRLLHRSEEIDGKPLLAKSGSQKEGEEEPYKIKRRHFRHELASALAWLEYQAHANDQTTSLIAYLIAAHHGKVRLSIRSMPGETQPSNTDDAEQKAYVGNEPLFARGIWHQDELPEIALKTDPDGEATFTLEPCALDLRPMRLGRFTKEIDGTERECPSWLERTLALRDANDFGPFHLAYLEMLLRAADARASAKNHPESKNQSEFTLI